VVNAGTLLLGGYERLLSAGSVELNGGVFNLGGNTQTTAAVTLNAGAISNGTLSGALYAVLSGDISANLAGSGALTKTTTGLVTLSGLNSYSGGTVVNDGTLALGVDNTLLSSGAVSVNGGELALGTTSQTVGAFTLSGGAITGGVLTGTSYIVEAGTIGTVLSGALVALTKNTVGTVLLNGSNQYGGGTTLNAGTLLLGASERLLDSGSVTLNGGVFDLANYSETIGMLTLRGGSVVNGSLFASVFNLEVGTVNTVFSGAAKVVKTTGGLVDLLSANTYSGGTEIYDGTLRLGGNDRLSVSGALSVLGGALELNGYTQSAGTVLLSGGLITGGTLTGTSYVVEAGTISAVLAGNGVTLTKNTVGSVLLSAANTYTGTTTVSTGTLSLGVDNALALGTSVVVNGGELALGTTTQSVAALSLTAGC